MPLTFPGLEPAPADTYVTVCATEPMWSYIQAQYEGYIYNILLMQGIHTHTTKYRYRQYIHILTDTYTYIHSAIGARRQFSGSAAAD